MRKNTVFIIFAVLLGLSVWSCSIEKMVVEKLADSLSSGMGNSFTGENDPELVGDALPFALKLYDSLLEQVPEHTGLLLSTGSAYIMYANAYLQTPAEMLPVEEYEKKCVMLSRAKNLYLRGRDFILKALDVKYPQFVHTLQESKDDTILLQLSPEDVPLLYWAAAGWMAAYSTDTMDMKLSLTLHNAYRLMKRALELNEEFNNGAIHDFFISYYGSMPEGLGGSEEKARYHFKRAVEISEGTNASPYLSLALSISVKKQDSLEFRELLHKALSINPDDTPSSRLVNIIIRRKAQWYLDHIEDYFI